ncbi:S1 RNA-binding domain-containing protein [Streptococcus pneumoniae]|nr:S1 RNA-binding domain-containing protein [Streptococcus pneumoniae]VMP48507.1 S1 RNA-binding domain-containing protein [Streptococcus pneumoniae]VQO71780.1 S1 RNA-binding domain-containing protein [Streptococcus pneumoniae]
MILFENLFKPGQLHLAVDMLLTSSVLSATSKQCFELTSSVLSTTSKQCFEQPVTSFLIDVLIFIAYNQKEKFSPEKHIE